MGQLSESSVPTLVSILNELLQKTEPADLQNIAGAGALTIGAGQVLGAGNTLLLTPAAGKRLRLYYVSYNPAGATEVGFRFGVAGTIWLQNNLVANSVISKDFKDFKYIQGAIDQSLYLNQSLAVTTDWTVFYLEV